MKLYTFVIHYLQMCMKEYGCCPKFKRGDNSMTDTNPIIVKITRETGLPDFGGQSPIGSKHEDEVLNDDAGSVEEFLAKTKGAFDSMTEILVAIHVIVMKGVFEV
jgi:hypothetical protein